MILYGTFVQTLFYRYYFYPHFPNINVIYKSFGHFNEESILKYSQAIRICWRIYFAKGSMQKMSTAINSVIMYIDQMIQFHWVHLWQVPLSQNDSITKYHIEYKRNWTFQHVISYFLFTLLCMKHDNLWF